jgi:hypothetical protein
MLNTAVRCVVHSGVSVNVLGKKLDLPALQQLLLQITADNSDSQLQTCARGKAASAANDASGAAAASRAAAAAAKVVCFDLESAHGVDDEGTPAATATAAAAAEQLLASLQGAVIKDDGGCHGSSQDGADKVSCFLQHGMQSADSKVQLAAAASM